MISAAPIPILIIAGLAAAAVLWRVVPGALSRPGDFPAAPWGWPDAIFSAGLAAFFLSMAAASFGRPEGRVNLNAVVASLVLYAAIVILVIGFLVFRGINPVEAFGLRWPGWVRGMFVIVPCAMLLTLPFVFLAQVLGYLISGPDSAPQAIVTFLLESRGWKERTAVAAVAVLAAPVTEELVFRGCIYGVVRKYGGRMAAVIGTSVLFALIHGHVPSLPGLFLLAVGLALVYERTGSLWAPVGFHAAFNAITIVAAVFFPDLAK
jgi:membrane protease YdiL (CAAX protease family)